MRYASPGTNDQKRPRDDLWELNPSKVEAVPNYYETEFHTWGTGVDFLEDQIWYAWRIAWAVDRCFGYVRRAYDPYTQDYYGDVTGTKRCAWASS